MPKNTKCLISILFISFLGNNCSSMEELIDNNPAPQSISEIKSSELRNSELRINRLEQENIQLKNQVKQLSEQMQQLLTKENDMKQVNESCNNKYLELKSIYKQFYRVQMFETTKFGDIFNRNHNDTEQEILKKIPMYTSNIEDTKQFLELCLPNILCNNTKNTVQLMIDRYNNALVKIDECKSLINQLFTASTKDRGQKKQKLHIICSEIDSETRKNKDLWRFDRYGTLPLPVFYIVYEEIRYEIGDKRPPQYF